MGILDFSHLSTEQRLDLIGELCESLEATRISVSPAQRAEIRRRVSTLNTDIAAGREARDVLADLRHTVDQCGSG